jgi:hypothetical protein
MKVETRTAFVADDGTRFNNEDACRKYDEKCKQFRSVVTQKIGEYKAVELLLGGHAMMDSLPFKAPWLSAFGAGFINVVDVRRSDGEVEFQLAGEDCVPYEGGTAWCKAESFYSEWPD